MAVWDCVGLRVRPADVVYCVLSRAWLWEAQKVNFDPDRSPRSYEEITRPRDRARQEEVGVKQVNELRSRVQTAGPRSQS